MSCAWNIMVWRASFSLEQLEKCFIHCVALHQIYMFQLDWKRKEIRC